jgi:hypothetical protein
MKVLALCFAVLPALASCDDAEDTRILLGEARAALAGVPQPFHPQSLVVEILPRGEVQRAAVDASRGVILVEQGLRLDRSVWLHEIAHLRLRGARPEGLLGRRIHRAIEEGVADYFAAVLGRSPALSARDLRSAPPPSAAVWGKYLTPRIDADAHELGWQLGGLLWTRAPHSSELLQDLVTTLSGTAPYRAADRPADILREVIQRCPVRSRALLRTVFATWIPSELWS